MHLESKEREREEGYVREVEERDVGNIWNLTLTVHRNGTKITMGTFGVLGLKKRVPLAGIWVCYPRCTRTTGRAHGGPLANACPCGVCDQISP